MATVLAGYRHLDKSGRVYLYDILYHHFTRSWQKKMGQGEVNLIANDKTIKTGDSNNNPSDATVKSKSLFISSKYWAKNT